MSITQHTVGIQSIHDLPQTTRKWQQEANALYLCAALTSVIGPEGVHAYKGANDYVAATAVRGQFHVGCYFRDDGGLWVSASQEGNGGPQVRAECRIKGPLGGAATYEARQALEAAGVPLLP